MAHWRDFRKAIVTLAFFAIADGPVMAEVPPPVLTTVFPAGAQAGQTVELTLGGSHLQGQLQTLKCSAAGVRCELKDGSKCQLVIPAETVPGTYELWAVGINGVSAPRSFWIGNRAEQREAEPNDSADVAAAIPLNSVVNGQIDKPSDVDHFRFEARQGQRVIIECLAERIDSRLRAVIEVFDASGKRLAVNRGYFESDPLIDFHVPADGAYVIKVQDLVSSGSAEHYYRLDIDTGPRVVFSVPSVVERGRSAAVTLYGWNLGNAASNSTEFERLETIINPEQTHETGLQPFRMLPAQTVLDIFAYHLPGSHAAIPIGLTNATVVLEQPSNQSPGAAQTITYPCEVSGQLTASNECDWYAIEARRGEVVFLEMFAQRLQSPLDPQISIFDAQGQREIAQFSDFAANSNDLLPIGHLDPAGRWVAPADGRYLIAVRNLVGGQHADPRRVYRLSVRREDPEFQLLIVPRRDNVAGLNVPRGGRDVLEVLAFRHRGMTGPIRISAQDLPLGVECPDVWLGAGVDRTSLVVSADRGASAGLHELKLVGTAGNLESHSVRAGTVIRPGTPNGWGRLTSQIPLAVTGDATLRILANGHGTVDHHLYGKLTARHSPGGILDIEVNIERGDTSHQAPVRLTGVGLPLTIENQSIIIPAGDDKGFLSFYLPTTLATGPYTVAVRAETTVPTPDKKKSEKVVVYSNPVTIDVKQAVMVVEVDPFAPTRAKRGEHIQIPFTVNRRNGFIGKVHTELAAPGHVTNIEGLLSRGVTFTGQADKGSIELIVKDTAPLGRQHFLRLFAVGVLEDEALFHGSQVVPLEIVE